MNLIFILSIVALGISFFLFTFAHFGEDDKQAKLIKELNKAKAELIGYKSLCELLQQSFEDTGLKVFYAYKNEKSMAKGIRGRLAHNLAKDILKEYGDPTPNAEGIYTYKLLVKRIWEND